MYGIPAKRFDDDYYRDHKALKNVDFAVGFLISAAAWYFLFMPTWWIAPLIIFVVAMAGILLKVQRRYYFYGMLAVAFFPLVIWGAVLIGWAGRNEIKS